MDPATSGGILGIGGGILSAIGRVNQGSAQAAQQRSLAQDSQYEATVAKQNAAAAYQQGSVREDMSRMQSGQQIGELRAAEAQSGVVTANSSSAGVERQSMVNQEMNALGIRYQADTAATGQLNQSAIYSQQAARQYANAGNARTSGYLGATGSLFSAAGSYLRTTNSPLNTAGWFG